MSNHRDELFYSAVAKTRIRDLGGSELNRFLSAIQRQKLDKWLLSALPKLNGFRSTGSVAADEQRRRFLTRLISREQRQTEDRDWHLFKHLWLTWVRETIAGDELLKYLEDFDRGQHEASKTIDDLQETVRHKLKALIDERELPRESLLDFIRFAPFDSIGTFDNLVSSAVSQSALEREKVVESLPARLSALEAELSRTSNLARDRSELDVLRDEITQLQTLANANESAFEAAKEENNRFSVALEQAKQDLKAHLAILDSKTEIQEKRIGELVTRHQSESAELFLLREQLQSHRELLDGLSQNLHSALQSRGAPTVDPSAPEHSPPAPSEGAQHQPTKLGSKIRFTIRDTLQAEVEPVVDLPTFLGLLAENLSSIGLLGPSADAVALDVVAAALSGQLISFSGSMARPLIDLLMRALASRWAIAYVPIGLTSDDDLSELLSNSSDLTNLALSTSNASAFEIYGQPLRQCLLSGGPNRLNLTIAEIISGPGVLPIIPSYCDLGPIICTDFLLWTNSPRRPALRSCNFDRNAITAALAESDDNDDELFQKCVEVQKLMPLNPSVAFRRSLYQAAKVLRDSEATQAVCIASLVRSWLIPFAIASGLSIIEIRDLISKSDAKESLEDSRVRSVLQIK